jgi:hypothetical protein
MFFEASLICALFAIATGDQISSAKDAIIFWYIHFTSEIKDQSPWKFLLLEKSNTKKVSVWFALLTLDGSQEPQDFLFEVCVKECLLNVQDYLRNVALACCLHSREIFPNEIVFQTFWDIFWDFVAIMFGKKGKIVLQKTDFCRHYYFLMWLK